MGCTVVRVGRRRPPRASYRPTARPLPGDKLGAVASGRARLVESGFGAENVGEADADLDELLTAPEVRQRPRRRPPGGAVVTGALLVLCTLPFLGWAALPLLGIDSDRYTSALVALTPYAVPAGSVIVLFALVLRRWLTSLVVGVVVALLVVSIAPRVVANTADTSDNAPRGVPNSGSSEAIPLRILSSNLYLGGADPARVVDLVRRKRIDVLTAQELTPEVVAALDREGLSRLLPHRVFHAGAGGTGTGIASRYPLRELSLMPPTTLAQPSARVDLPGPRDVDVVAVHPVIPVGQETARWKRELGSLPESTGPGRTPRVAAGDFNATLDHTPVRGLLGRGYADAAERTGRGLRPTWPDRGRVPPLVPLDHVLAGGGLPVRDYGTFDVAGTDHRAVFAELVVPR